MPATCSKYPPPNSTMWCAWKIATAGRGRANNFLAMDPQPTLSERLIERRLLSGEELDRVLKLQQEHQAPLSRLVVELGFLSEEDLLPVLRDHFSLPVMSLKDVPPTPLPIELPAGIGDFLKLARMVPVKVE